MPITVNRPRDRVELPTVTLLGQRIRETDGTILATHNEVVTTLEEVISGNTVTKRSVLAFQGDVRVTIAPDPKFNANSYNRRDARNEIIGDTGAKGTTVNGKSDTYYTINGKDPIRTQANLYTGQFRIRRNLAGHDNIVLKAKTYYMGGESEVMKVEFKIARADLNKV